jgi:Spy/CpxP family protein refolding chaperone
MHPAFYWWHKHARRAEHCGAHASPDHDGFFASPPPPPPGPPGFDGGPFGVRRPLRFLAHKLDLSEAQTAELARILEELKTERAQAEVDQRRTITAFADAIENETFGEARAKEGGEQRVKSSERLRDAVVQALSRIHSVLNDDQRKRLAYLIRTGVLAL